MEQHEDIELTFVPVFELSKNNNSRYDSNLPSGYVDYDENLVEVINVRLTVSGHEIQLTENQIVEITRIIKNDY